ncbi:protein translocase subunit SecF [Patescibacteria group bacterium]|nr:protein translocase subunit SecF [Patescibacteria group bacterium]
MKGKQFGKVGIILLAALILGIVSLPPETKAPLVSWAPDYIKEQQVHLGLDLQGGSELDYKLDLRKVPEADKASIIDGVRQVIENRVNGLGVSEPNIFVSEIAGESHIIVDLAGANIDEAKDIIGKTIQLEFKEQKTSIDPNEKAQIEQNANNTLSKIKDGADFAVTGQEEELSNPASITYNESDWQFRDEISNADLAEKLFNMEVGQVYDGTIDTSGEYTVNSDGQFVEVTGVNIIKLLDKQDTERTVNNKRAVQVSHILISYAGSETGDTSITRTQAEASDLATELLGRLNAGEDFAELAKEYSDDAGSKELGGILAAPAIDGENKYVPVFEKAAVALQEKGDLSPVVESVFGYHIIQAGTITPESEKTTTETQVKYAKIFYSTIPSDWQETALTGEHFERADVEFNQSTYQPYIAIKFTAEGADLFADITGRNIGKPLAIFVGGDLISAPRVNTKINGGSAIIEGSFTIPEASNLARDLNTGAIPAPIVLSGQYTIGATLGQEALSQSLWAGIIGLIVLVLYMIAYYRAQGLMAVIALGIYAITLIFLIQCKLNVIISAVIAIAIFVLLMAKILNSKDNGWEKLLSGILAIFALFFIVYLLANPIVLTLAGVAGVVLSIGMAVDANVLIFERIKEEIRDGRSYGSAIEIGFARAWKSIRDSNFSSLLTCAILFYFGSSIIQGFAFNLAAGILVSMLTAIIVTKSFLQLLVGTKIAENAFLIGAKKTKKDNAPFKIIENTKMWFTFSGVILSICLVAALSFGLKLGIDFTGGTLMQINFENEVTQENLRTALEEIGQEISGNAIVAEQTNSETTSPLNDTPVLSAETQDTFDMSSASIMSSDDGYIIKTKWMSPEVHDEIILKLEAKFGTLEEPRFTTVGPTVGETMKSKAILALIIALIVIVLYIAFAFRKIPRNVSPWRFGVSAIVALAHDILIVVGVFAILGKFMGVEVDALFITALLTILGFSVHDTIVVFDRLRENLKNLGRDVTFGDIANQALTQTMARSMNTSISTLFTLVALLILGSSSIFYFVLALVIGTIVGTYSSIFIASPVLVWWNNRAENNKIRK